MTPTQVAALAGPRSSTAPAFRPEPPAPSAGLPIAVGLAIFVSSIGALIQFEYMFYIQMVLVPLVIFGYALLGIGTKPLRDIRIEVFLFPVLFWVITSIGWTHGSPVDAAKSVALDLALVLSVHIAVCIFDSRAVLEFLAKASAVMAVLVLLDAVFRADTAFSSGLSEAGLQELGLRSFFYQKNSLGAALVLGYSLRNALRPRWLRFSYSGLIIVLLLLCRSSTSLIAAAAITVMQLIMTMVAQERRRGGSGSTFIFAGLTVMLVSVLFAAKNVIFGLFGKDATLSGRSVIWKYAYEAVKAHPWIGYGPGGFWGVSSAPLGNLRDAAGWTVMESHQGIIDQALEYGVVGVVLGLLAYAACAYRIGKRIMGGDDSPVVSAGLGLWIATVTATLTEGVLIRPGLVTVGLVSGLLLNTPPDVRSPDPRSPMSRPARMAATDRPPTARVAINHPSRGGTTAG